MNKLAVSLCVIATILLITACTGNKVQDISIIKDNISYITNDGQVQPKEILESNLENTKKSNKINKDVNMVQIPISIVSKNVKDVKYLEIEESSSLEEKIQLIIDSISEECFNKLPINVTIFGNETAKVELVEDLENSRISWKDDYLNEYTKEYTVNTIIKNIIQEGYKGMWIKKVQLYYEDELISLD